MGYKLMGSQSRTRMKPLSILSMLDCTYSLAKTCINWLIPLPHWSSFSELLRSYFVDYIPLCKTLNKTQLTVLKLCVFLQSTHIIFNILTTKQQTANAKPSEFLQSPLPPKLCVPKSTHLACSIF